MHKVMNMCNLRVFEPILETSSRDFPQCTVHQFKSWPWLVVVRAFNQRCKGCHHFGRMYANF